jgi:urea ABC transporter ATP-binding protein UrtE
MLRIENLVAGYVAGGRVLDGLSLDIARGETVALLGRNGMGKSTLMKTITGHLRPTAGAIDFCGRPIAARRPFEIARSGVGYVPQGREIFADFTVEENLRMGVLGKPGLGRSVPDWAFELFPILRERKAQRAGTMSGGQQQQLAIMRALVGRPEFLLLDEPSEGIQPSIVHDIGAALKGFANERNLTILLVEQNLDLVRLLATRALFIEDGRIVDDISDVGRLETDAALVNRYLSV